MVMEKQGEVAILQTQADAATNYDGLYGAGRQRRIIGALLPLGALLASQLNNPDADHRRVSDGAALPV